MLAYAGTQTALWRYTLIGGFGMLTSTAWSPAVIRQGCLFQSSQRLQLCCSCYLREEMVCKWEESDPESRQIEIVFRLSSYKSHESVLVFSRVFSCTITSEYGSAIDKCSLVQVRFRFCYMTNITNNVHVSSFMF